MLIPPKLLVGLNCVVWNAGDVITVFTPCDFRRPRSSLGIFRRKLTSEFRDPERGTQLGRGVNLRRRENPFAAGSSRSRDSGRCRKILGYRARYAPETAVQFGPDVIIPGEWGTYRAEAQHEEPAQMPTEDHSMAHRDPPYHPDLNKNYSHLSADDVAQWLEHGWLRVTNALDSALVDQWVSELWVRTGYDEHDKTTWDKEYFHMPRHREVPAETFCPEAWAKIKEICGGGLMVEDRVDEDRETFYGDGFIVNWGTAEKAGGKYEEYPPNEKVGLQRVEDCPLRRCTTAAS